MTINCVRNKGRILVEEIKAFENMMLLVEYSSSKINEATPFFDMTAAYTVWKLQMV